MSEDDLVARLLTWEDPAGKGYPCHPRNPDGEEAAAELSRLREEVEEWQEYRRIALEGGSTESSQGWTLASTRRLSDALAQARRQVWEEAAGIAEGCDLPERDWMPQSLYATIRREIASAIRSRAAGEG